MVYVTKEDNRYPFSKGILARSMSPTGLPLDTIYDVVRKIQQDLERDDVEEIESEELRSRGYSEPANNYRMSRHIAHYRAPVVVLIGGAAGVGKSAISAEISRRLGIERIIGTDTIREIMRYMIPRDLMPVLHESSFQAGNSLRDPYVKNKVIYAFRQQANLVSEGIRAYVERGKKEGLNAVINGVHLVPGLLSLDFDDPDNRYFHYVVYLDDEEEHRKRFHLRAEGSFRDPERYTRNMTNIRRIQDFMRESAENLNVMAINNTNFERTVQIILRDVTAVLEKEVAS